VASGGTQSGRSSRMRGWTLSEDEAQTLLTSARRAFFVMVGVLAVLWIIQVINFADNYGLNASYGIRPHDIGALPYLLTAPFLHVSWTHIEGNSGPLFIFGFLAAYRGIGKFAAVTLVVVITSGLAAWFFQPAHTVVNGVTLQTIGVGASGVVFGYFGYLMVRGIFDRRAIDVLVGAVMALCFAYQFSVLLPQQGIGWQDHIGGLVGGIASGWLFRDGRKARSVRSAAKGRKPAPASPSTSPGTVALPTASAQPGKGLKVDPDNPRADLYKQLDDLGL
jgi:membrane associated rhomboid family serine protease